MRFARFKLKAAALIICLSFVFMLTEYPPVSRADENEAETNGLPVDMGNARAAALFHPDTDTMLMKYNADSEEDVAGLVRMAPMLMVAEALDRGDFSLESDVVVSREAARVKGPTAFIEANETIKAEYLYKSAAMIGAGDAVYALIEAAFGSMDAFLPALNTRMSELGVFLEYSNPMGDGEKLSAESLAHLGAALYKTKLYSAYSSLYMDEITHSDGRTTELVNPNRLIRDLAGCTGLMTGSSRDAGYSGVFSASRGNDRFVCVVIGAKNSAERFHIAKNMLEYAFSTYKTLEIVNKGDVLMREVPVSGSVTRTVDLTALDDLYLLTEGNVSKKEIKPAHDEIPETIKAPVNAGDTVFVLEYKNSDGVTVGEVRLGVSEDISESHYSDWFHAMLTAWLTGSVPAI